MRAKGETDSLVRKPLQWAVWKMTGVWDGGGWVGGLGVGVGGEVIGLGYLLRVESPHYLLMD